ncbi:MAG: hypothetical protein A2005_01870 [Desulfuromonadales bacterium GWC2_61_20]|nr:MAG: hypothetical protein A2005_01870 [Desulfuromonadales bacterium GWC2_61_20]HAD04341.1 hypothetical protein [Desulfuromonas sp.]
MTQESEKKRGFLSRLSDALFEEVEASPEEETATALKTATATAGAAEVAPAPVDGKLRQELQQQLAKEGPLLGQFLELAASLGELIPQESASYQAALRALEQTGGASKADILASVDNQLAALASERTIFAESVEKKLAAQQATTRKSEEIRARISELQKSIQALEQEEQQLFAKMASEEKLIRTAQMRFDSAAREVERELRSKLEKIRNYLPDSSKEK